MLWYLGRIEMTALFEIIAIGMQFISQLIEAHNIGIGRAFTTARVFLHRDIIFITYCDTPDQSKSEFWFRAYVCANNWPLPHS